MNGFQKTVIVLLSAILIAIAAAGSVGVAWLRNELVAHIPVTEVEVSNPVTEVEVTRTIAVTNPALDAIARNTAPPEYARDFCTDAEDLWSLYEDAVYGDRVDNINQQAHRQREMRLELLVFCYR